MKLRIKHNRWLLVAMLCALWHGGEGFAADNQPLYENNFEKEALDKVPDEFLVLDGGFAVKAVEWQVEGKAWKQGATEAASWALSWTESAEPIPGRASIWGTPYATTPIRFDDLQMGRAAGK